MEEKKRALLDKFKKKNSTGIGAIEPHMKRYNTQRNFGPEGSGLGAIAHTRERYSATCSAIAP